MPSSTLLQFTLHVGSLPSDQFRVFEFTLEEGVSECYKLHIEAGSEDGDIPYADLIGKKATLIVSGEECETEHFGVVTGFNHAPGTGANFNRQVLPGMDLFLIQHVGLDSFCGNCRKVTKRDNRNNQRSNGYVHSAITCGNGMNSMFVMDSGRGLSNNKLDRRFRPA